MVFVRAKEESDMAQKCFDLLSKKRKKSDSKKYLSLVMMIISDHDELSRKTVAFLKDVSYKMDERSDDIGLHCQMISRDER